jgi:hypothetical protein
VVQFFSEAPGYSALDKELADLFHQRRMIDIRIREILGTDLTKPVWGPCTRCGHVWTGKWANRRPRHCARCHSNGWDQQKIKNAGPPKRLSRVDRDTIRDRFNAVGMPNGIAPPPRMEDVVAGPAPSPPVIFPRDRLEPPQPERSMRPSDVGMLARSEEVQPVTLITTVDSHGIFPEGYVHPTLALPEPPAEWLRESDLREEEAADDIT